MRALVLALLVSCADVSQNATDAGMRCDDVSACAPCVLPATDVIVLVNIWDWSHERGAIVENAVPISARMFPVVRFGYMNAKQNSPPAVRGPMQALSSYSQFVHNLDQVVENLADEGGMTPDLDVGAFAETMAMRPLVHRVVINAAIEIVPSEIEKTLTATCAR